MKRLPLVLLLGLAPLHAQENGIDQPFHFVAPSTGGKFIQWHSLTSRTYFTQVSDPAAHLVKWNWAPIIESGNDEDISYEVDSTADKGFFRLKYTDLPLDPGKTVDTSDFDKDGVSNSEEVIPLPSTVGGATDPLNADTDGDGLNDGFERNNGYNPNNSDENGNGIPDGQDNNSDGDGDGKSTLEEYIAGTSDSNGDDYTESDIVGPILWKRRWVTASSSKTGLFQQFAPTVPPNPPTPLISYYLTKTLTTLQEATTSGPTYSKYGTTDTTTLNPATLGIVSHVSNIDFNISQPSGSNYYPNFNNGVWELVTKSETHTTTKSVDEIAGSGSYKITSNGYTGSETYSYKTSLSDEYPTQMLIAAGDVKFAEMAAEKENEPWGYNYFPVIDISTYTEKDEHVYSRTETDYALEPRYSPDAPVRVAWLDVNRTDLGRGYLGGTPDPAATQSITLHEKYYSKEKAAVFQQPPGIAGTPRTEIRRLAPELNKARLILPLGCALGVSLDPGSMVVSQDANGQPLPIDWEDPQGGYLSVDFQHGHWTNYVQFGDVVSDEFDVPIKLEALEGGEKIRLAEIITTSAGTAYLPITLPIADVRGFTEGFVVQTLDPGKIVLKASLTTKHGLKVSKRSDADVIPPVEVSWQAVPGFNNIDDHNDPWGNPIYGLRIFPDYKNPTTTTLRNGVDVIVKTSPALAGKTIKVKAFDVDDSTDEAFSHHDPVNNLSVLVIDDNGPKGNDNFGTHQAGQFLESGSWGDDTAEATVGATGEAKFTLKVGMQPGDNYKVVVTDVASLAFPAAQVTDPSLDTYLGPATTQASKAPSTSMLTVWRKLWVENDSMGEVKSDGSVIGISLDAYGNKLNDLHQTQEPPTIQDISYDSATNLTKFTIPQPVDLSSFLDLENGHLKIAGVSHPVDSTSQATRFVPPPPQIAQTTVTEYFVFVKGHFSPDGDFPSVPEHAGFRLYDDDDDGLTEPPLPRTNLVNSIVKDYYKPAFIDVVDAATEDPAHDYNSRKYVPFRANDDVSSLFTVADDAVDLPDRAELWVCHLVACYQREQEADIDPNTYPTTENEPAGCGLTTNLNSSPHSEISAVYVETCRDSVTKLLESHPSYPISTELFIAAVVTHEMGHQPGTGSADDDHFESGLMGEGATGELFGPRALKFKVESILRFRKAQRWSE
ncbi:MAG: hypothetical protein ABIT37_07320 [Luteolibacter sp.]